MQACAGVHYAGKLHALVHAPIDMCNGARAPACASTGACCVSASNAHLLAREHLRALAGVRCVPSAPMHEHGTTCSARMSSGRRARTVSSSCGFFSTVNFHRSLFCNIEACLLGLASSPTVLVCPL